MTAKAETQSIHQEYDFPYPPAKVWRALTDSKLLAQWLMNNDMRPEIGQSFTFRMEPTQWWDGVVHCDVLELEPEKRLSYTWRSGPESSPLDTVVTWTLTPTASGTRLSLEHTGFVPKNKFAFQGADQGWRHMVGERLRKLLESSASH
jgi:uncharacterized protein YndB with AHSA1/START domain